MTDAASPLNRLRAELGEYEPAPPRRFDLVPPAPVSVGQPSSVPPSLADVAAAGGARAERRGDDERIFLAGVAVVGLVVACLHGVTYSALSRGHSWWQHWAAAAMGWPDPVVQPILAVMCCAGIAILAVATRGLTRVRPWQFGMLIGASVVTILAAVPLVMLAILWVAVVLFFVAIVLAIIFGILAGS